MNELKFALQEIKKNSYEKGLLVGKQAARDQNKEEVKKAYQKGLGDAYKKFMSIAQNKCNFTDETADLLPNMVLLPNKGFQKISKELNFHLDEFLNFYYDYQELGRESANDIYQNYKKYCSEKHIKVCPTATAFGRALSTKLYKEKSHGLIWYHGIARKAQQV